MRVVLSGERKKCTICMRRRAVIWCPACGAARCSEDIYAPRKQDCCGSPKLADQELRGPARV